MAIVKLPSGEYVDVADGTTPERLQQIMRENPARKAAARPSPRGAPPQRSGLAPVNSEQAEVQQRLKERRGSFVNSGIVGAGRDFAQGFTMNFLDELGGAGKALTKGVGRAITTGDLGQIGRTYRVERDVLRAEDRERKAQGGIGGTAAEIAGALAAPVGLVGRGAKLGAEALGIAKAAPRVAAAASRAARPVVARAALAGAAQGAANGVGVDDSGTVSGAAQNALNGGLVGGAAGGLIGGVVQGAQRGAQVIRDRSAANASNTAYSRIADLLGKAPRVRQGESGPQVVKRPDGSTMTYTPESAARELAVANGRGSDAVVGDLSNGLQILSGKTSRNAESLGSNAMFTRAEGRMANRPQEIEDQIAGRIQPKTGTDALKFQQANTGARKAAGQRDYEAVLDRPIAWTPELNDFVTKPNPLVRKAMGEAERLMRSQDIDPTTLGLQFGPDGVLMKVERPTMRTFDYMKRGLDAVSRGAKQAGDGDGARIAGEQVAQLKDAIAKVNPEYRKVLDTQRGFFQQDSAAELGKTVVGRLTGARADPRQLLQEIQQVHPNDRDALRTGFADALMSLRDTKTAGKGPVAVLQAMTRSPNQRKVLENLFEGRGNLGRFERWLTREVRAAKTDAKVAGPQSVTSENMMNSVVPGGDVGGLAMDTLRGVAYGGPTGAVSAGLRKLDNLANSTSAPVNDEIARILMSRGEDLVAGVGRANTFRAARKVGNRRRAIRAARGAQQPFTDTLED